MTSANERSSCSLFGGRFGPIAVVIRALDPTLEIVQERSGAHYIVLLAERIRALDRSTYWDRRWAPYVPGLVYAASGDYSPVFIACSGALVSGSLLCIELPQLKAPSAPQRAALATESRAANTRQRCTII